MTSGSLHAAVIAGTSSAIGLDANVSVLGLIAATPVQIGFDSASAPGVYNDSQSAVAVNANVGASLVPVGSITALGTQGVLSTNLQSNVDGFAGSKSASGTATLTGPLAGGPFTARIADVDLIITNPPALITLSATTIQTISTVAGDYGTLTATGTAILADFTLSANGGSALSLGQLGLTAGVDFNAATGEILLPNVVVNLAALGIADATLILNRQVKTFDTAGHLSLEVTAIALDVNAATVSVVPGVTVDLDLVKSYAELTAVPEPHAISLLLGTFGLLFLRRQRW